MDYLNIIVSILSGLAVCIPLVVKLVQAVQKATQEKNWGTIMNMVIGYMETAEKNYTDGATKKAWVMSMVEQSAKAANYTLDEASIQKISDLIDSMCDMAKVVNAVTEKA